MDFSCPTTRNIIGGLRRQLGSHNQKHLDYETEPSTVACSYLSETFLKKFYDPDSAEAVPVSELEMVALADFLLVERRLAQRGRDGYFGLTNDILAGARKIILSALGRFDLREYEGLLGLTNGASTRLRRKDGHPVFKMSGTPHVTRNCALLAGCFFWSDRNLREAMQRKHGPFSVPSEGWFEIVEGSEQFSVPKTSTSVRLAAKEPDLNLLFQKGIGEMIRRRLKRNGIDLNDDTTNQYYALIGSRTGSLATLDLKAASDSVSLDLLRDLLPWEWVRMILMTRSPAMRTLDGNTIRLAKVSTMGNGFTFELESLIFWALAKATIDATGSDDRRLTVFGDDIILHHEPASILAVVLQVVGFEVNTKKSFLHGPFRESCGGHYWLGKNIKPFYLSTGFADKQTRPLEVAFLLNAYLAWCDRVGFTPHFDWVKYLIKTFAPDMPVVPSTCDPRQGLYGPPLRGVYFSLRRSGYVYKTYTVEVEKVRKRLSSGTALSYWLRFGTLPGSSDRLGDSTCVTHSTVKRSKRLKRAQDSRWEFPAYCFGWGDSLFE